ncbi:DNA-directed RNA polymerase subunit delta [Bacillus marasmi]|uniref:DNA-directed RNA polymerase subunit delta n=1 Tax=Bacillus marasmi TaxID=1926279 RepID=UPI0011C98A1A|nr:DNA-directed RNA polymerase subunit delta [Bacillus marasmi]
MGLQQYSKEQLQEMSFIEVAYELLAERKQAVTFQEIMDEIKSVLNLNDEQVKSKIAQFYTDLNIDGRFLCLGENRWGLRVWYPVDQVEEEIITPVKTKKKKAKKVVEDDFDDFDEVEEDEDLGFDDIDELDDDDDILDEDLEIDDDDDLDIDDDDDDIEEIELDEDDDLDDDEDLDDEDENL